MKKIIENGACYARRNPYNLVRRVNSTKALKTKKNAQIDVR